MAKFTGSKALSLANKTVVPLAGGLAFFADPIAQMNGELRQWPNAVNFMVNRLLNWRFPDLRQWTKTIMDIPIYRNNIIGGGLAAIGIPLAQKWLREFGVPIPNTVNRILDVLKRAAAGACAGGTAAALMWLPAIAVAVGYPGMPPIDVGKAIGYGY